MHNIEVVGKINEYLHTAAKLLESWLDKMLPKVSENWWQECVIYNLSYNQREIAENNQYSNLSDFDLAALLRITDKSWYAMRAPRMFPSILSLLSLPTEWRMQVIAIQVRRLRRRSIGRPRNTVGSLSSLRLTLMPLKPPRILVFAVNAPRTTVKPRKVLAEATMQ